MSKVDQRMLEDQVLETLDGCIGKMANRLNTHFDPEDKASLSLFRQFCSALKTRMTWLKDFMACIQDAAAKVIDKKLNAIKKRDKNVSGTTWTDQQLSKPNPNFPFKPEQLQNGLCIK